MNRKKTTISDKVGGLLVSQIAHELLNHSIYMTFANYFSIEGITKLEDYYKKRAMEEYHHHDWIRERLNEADYEFSYPAVEPMTDIINDIIDPFKLTVDVEIKTTMLISAIADVALEEKDWQTFTWLQSKLIPEQHEEETLSRMALNIIMKETTNIYERAEEIYDLLGD